MLLIQYFPARPISRSAIRRHAAATVLLLAAAIGGGCSGQAPQAPATPPPAVGVLEVGERAVKPFHEFVGKTRAAESVALRARVTGFLESRAFDEGGQVDVGQVLFRIQPEQYQAMLAQAEGELAAATASLNRARVDLERFEELVKSKSIPQMKVDEGRAEVLVQEAAVQKAEAAVARARLDLEYTEIRAPIEGRIDAAQLDVGNLVGPDSGVLATINQMDPMQVVFSITEADFIDLARQSRGDIASGRVAADPAYVPLLRFGDGQTYAQQGRIDFFDNKVNEQTGTVQIRAAFPNPDGLLLPGQFVTVLVERKEPRSAVLVPQAAVLTDQGGHYVLLVDDASQVEVRRIRAGQRFGADLLVEEGLQPGDRIVLHGIQKVRPGVTVKAEPVAPETPPPARS